MIRKAKNNGSDIDSIQNLIKAGVKTGGVLARSDEEIQKAITNFFVYEKDNRIVGCCALDVYSKKLAEVRSLCVLPNFQKKGIGSKLVKHCIKYAKIMGIYEILAITSCQNLFESVGFKPKIGPKQPLLMKLG